MFGPCVVCDRPSTSTATGRFRLPPILAPSFLGGACDLANELDRNSCRRVNSLTANFCGLTGLLMGVHKERMHRIVGSAGLSIGMRRMLLLLLLLDVVFSSCLARAERARWLGGMAWTAGMECEKESKGREGRKKET